MRRYSHILLLFGSILISATNALSASFRYFHPESAEPVSELWRWQEAQELSQQAFLCMSEAANGSLWVGTENGISTYASNHWSQITTDYPVEEIFCTSSNRIYFLTATGLYALDGGEVRFIKGIKRSNPTYPSFIELNNGLICLRSSSGMVLLKPNGTSETFGRFNIKSFALMPDQSIWISRGTSELLKLTLTASPDKISATWSPIQPPHIKFEGKLQLYRQSNGPLWVISNDAQHHIWKRNARLPQWEKISTTALGTQPIAGLLQTADRTLWILKGQKLWSLRNTTWNAYSAPEYPLPALEPKLYETSDGNMWMAGARSKVYRIDRANTHWESYQDLSFQCEAEDGTRWFIYKGVHPVHQEPLRGRWEEFTAPEATIPKAAIIRELKDGSVCMLGGTDQLTISFFDGQNWKKQTFTNQLGLTPSSPLVELDDGSLILGQQRIIGQSSGGLLKLYRKGNTITRHELFGYPRSTTIIQDLALSKNGTLWAGGTGLYQFEDRRLKPVRSINAAINASRISSLAIQDQDVWVSAWGRGIFRFKNNEWISYAAPEAINTIMTDDLTIGPDQSVWAITDLGVGRFDGTQWTVPVLLPDMRFHQGGAHVHATADRKTWITLLTNPHDPYERVTTICYKPSTNQPQTIITQSRGQIPYKGDHLVRWTGNAALFPGHQKTLHYSYRLNDGPWSPFTTQEHTQLQNLPSGDYQIEVRARDLDFNIDSTPAMARFTVEPPLWLQPGALALITLFIIITLAFIVLIIQMRLRHARNLDEVKMQFYFNITHELRTPLTLIKGPVETLLEQITDTDKRNALTMVQRNAAKLSRLIDQLLGFQKMEQQGEELELAPGNLKRFIDEIIGAHLTMAQEQQLDVEITNTVTPNLLLFDADKLQKVLDNLLNNAIKYTPNGGDIKIITTLQTANNKEHLSIIVEDTGSGIPPKDHDKIFERFYRHRESAHTNREGFGIGLSYVKRIIEIYEGEIGVESPILEKNGVPAGSRFICRIPVKKPDAHAIPNLPEDTVMEPDPTVDLPPSTNKNVLLIEDNADMREFLKGLLSKIYTIQTATNGMEGLEIAQAESIDLVLTDYMMPHMDGFELCRALKGDPETSHIPVIILTARQAPDCQVEGLQSGADAYLTKPVNIELLLNNIHNILESRNQLREKYRSTESITPAEVTTNAADQKFLEKAFKVVQDHLDDYEFNVSVFAQNMHMSRMTLHRKIKAITGETTTAFIRSNRMKHAAQLFKEGYDSVSEVSLLCGFLDLSYFSRIFREHYGCPPSQYSAQLLAGKTPQPMAPKSSRAAPSPP